MLIFLKIKNSKKRLHFGNNQNKKNLLDAIEVVLETDEN